MRKKNNSSSKKSNSRRKDSWEDHESRDMKRDDRRKKTSTSTTNDPVWYAMDPALLRDSSSIPFSWPLGMKWTRTGRDFPGSSGPNPTKYDSIPGLMVQKLVPTFGAGLDSDALNVAASSTYTYVRHTNAGHANYDPNDLMLYIIAMTSVYSFINYAERIYAIATLYEQRNRYLPDTLFQAMDINPDDIKNNLADYRFAINVLINKISSIAVPASMSVFLRHAMLYAYIYSEGTSVKDQLYMYAPVGFLKFGLDADSAGCLTLATIPHTLSGKIGWKDIITFGNDLFNAIWEQEDFGIMSGDILKSYGSNILSIKSLDEVLPFSTVYDPMVLHQMKNATPWMEYDPSTMGVFQNTAKNKLIVELNADGISDADLKPLWYNVTGSRVLTLDSDNPTPEMVIEATRLMSGILSVGSETPIRKVKLWAGSEMVVDTVFYGRLSMLGNNNDTTWDVSVNSNVRAIVKTSVSWTDLAAIDSLTQMSKAFKFAPGITIPVYNAGEDTPAEFHDFKEVDNYAVLSEEDLQKMHTAAILNLLHVPSAAKNVTV